jgi:hypothetical protein
MRVVFDHERLEVYRVAVECADAADSIAAKLKRGNAHTRDQLRRARESIIRVIEVACELLKWIVEVLTRLIQSTARRWAPDRDRDRDPDRDRDSD